MCGPCDNHRKRREEAIDAVPTLVRHCSRLNPWLTHPADLHFPGEGGSEMPSEGTELEATDLRFGSRVVELQVLKAYNLCLALHSQSVEAGGGAWRQPCSL